MTTFSILAAFLRRDWMITRSYRLGFVMGLLGSLFNLGTYFFIGRLIDRSSLGSYEGLERGYFPFMLLGMIMVNLVSTSLATFAATLRNEQTTGSLEAMLATPPAPALLILGTSLYSFIRALGSVLLLLTLAILVFGVRFHFDGWSLLTALAAFLAMIAFFGALGIAFAGCTMVFKQVGPLTGLVVYGLSFLGGVYFPLDVLPQPLYWLAMALPFSWGLEVLRAALLTGESRQAFLAPLVLAAAIAIPCALWIFDRSLRFARKAGSLNQY